MNFPDPPHVGFVTEYLFENAWVIGGVLVGTAGLVGLVAFREGRWDRLKAVAVVALLGAAVLGIGAAVKTSGERAKQLVRALVEDAVAGRASEAMAHFAPDAVLCLGSPRNEGISIDSIRRGIEMLQREYRVEGNRVTQFDAYTIGSKEARVDMACTTEVSGAGSGGGMALSTWTFKVTRQADGSWKVEQLTWLSLNRQTPSLDYLR